MVFGFLGAVRIRRFLGKLTCAIRSSDVVGVMIWLLHRELENKTCRFISQEFLKKFAYTKVTGGIFFFKQKTAYEVGLGIPAEPLFRSTTPVIAGDSFEMDAVGALRLSPLRRGL